VRHFVDTILSHKKEIYKMFLIFSFFFIAPPQRAIKKVSRPRKQSHPSNPTQSPCLTSPKNSAIIFAARFFGGDIAPEGPAALRLYYPKKTLSVRINSL